MHLSRVYGAFKCTFALPFELFSVSGPPFFSIVPEVGLIIGKGDV
jgi:hypothetical protein